MNKIVKLKKLLARNDYNLEQKGSEYIIQSKGEPSTKIKFYKVFSIVLTILALVLFFIIGSLFLLLFLTVSIPMYLQAQKFKKEQASLTDRKLTISENKFIIDNEEGNVVLNTSDVEQLRYRFETSENLSTAKIIVIDSNNEYSILQIFNDDKRSLDHDAEDIVKELKAILDLNHLK